MNHVRQGVAALAAGVMIAALAVVAYAAGPDACDSSYTAPMNSTAKLKAYEACRFDRIDATQKRIEDKLNASPAPSPTVQPSSPTPDPSTPAPTTPAPTPAPTEPASSVCTNPTVTFTGEGSRGVGNGYDISAEQWAVKAGYKSTLKFCSKDSWSVDITAVDDGQHAVQSYPSIRRIFHDWSHTDFSKDPRLSSFKQLTVDYAVTGPTTCAGCIYEEAFDIWLNGIGGSNNTELMIWTRNLGQRPYGNKVASGIQIGGHTWDLWSGNSDHYVAYVPTDVTNTSPGNVDVKAFVNDLIARNRIADSAYNSLGSKTDPFVGQISFGVEPVATGGTSRHWDFTKFNVNES